MKLFNFLEEYGNETTIVEKLREVGLLRARIICERCGMLMREQKVKKPDGIRFECSRTSCRSTKSIRCGSFFENVKIRLCDAMLLLHLWCKGYSEKLICDDYFFANQTVVDWFRFCRELCMEYFEENQELIGGPGCVVELDETMVVKRKYNRGRVLAAGWLFGGIERREDGQFKCFMRLIYNRSGDHLKFLIRQHVALGTHIITDGWSGYTGLAEMGYQHSVIIHEENFVSADNPEIHTQRIESTWSSLKRFIRAHGCNKGEFYIEYICEYLFRRKFDDIFDELLNEIRRIYTF
jgi:hypothetical protein